MRPLLLAVLPILALVAPLGAQEEDFNPVIQVKYAAPPRALYMAALNAMEARGIPLRARLLDEALLTLPEFGKEQPGPGDTATVVYVAIEPAGDSTQLTIQARVSGAMASRSPAESRCLRAC